VYVEDEDISQPVESEAAILSDKTSNDESSKCASTSYQTDLPDINNRWEHKAILMLIDQYKSSLSLFTSTSVRNDVVWKSISAKLHENGFKYNRTQCENKFKNLKRQYQKKIDSMRNTGAASVKFEYFSQFDEIFGKKPNVNPIAIASSSRRQTDMETKLIEDALEENTSDSNNSNIKDVQDKIKKRKSKAEKFLEHIQNTEKEKEQSKRFRHEQLMEIQREAMQVFAQKMDKLIDKL
jgi:hypothetical protein